jgi:hypothetical protein
MRFVNILSHCPSIVSIAFAVGLLCRVAPADAADDGWHFSLEGSYLYGSVDGYSQVPNGGQPGTTSAKRPTLSEIGIDTTSLYDAQGIAASGSNEFYLGGQWIPMSGSATLDTTLISHGVTFPAGTRVSSSVDLDWYRIGYRRRMPLDRAGEWTLWPSAGAAVLDYSYKLDSTSDTASRGYLKVNAQLGLDTEWRPGRGPFAIDLQLFATPPITPPLPNMFQEELVGSYRLIDHQSAQLNLFAGVAFEQIWFEDKETVANHINFDFGPMLVAGIDFRF